MEIKFAENHVFKSHDFQSLLASSLNDFPSHGIVSKMDNLLYLKIFNYLVAISKYLPVFATRSVGLPTSAGGDGEEIRPTHMPFYHMLVQGATIKPSPNDLFVSHVCTFRRMASPRSNSRV